MGGSVALAGEFSGSTCTAGAPLSNEIGCAVNGLREFDDLGPNATVIGVGELTGVALDVAAGLGVRDGCGVSETRDARTRALACGEKGVALGVVIATGVTGGGLTGCDGAPLLPK